MSAFLGLPTNSTRGKRRSEEDLGQTRNEEAKANINAEMKKEDWVHKSARIRARPIEVYCCQCIGRQDSYSGGRTCCRCAHNRDKCVLCLAGHLNFETRETPSHFPGNSFWLTTSLYTWRVIYRLSISGDVAEVRIEVLEAKHLCIDHVDLYRLCYANVFEAIK